MKQRKKVDLLKDQLTLLLLLYKLEERNFQTKRLKLQKLVYLTNVFGAIFERKPTAHTFRVYKLGPFSGEIYTDIERLVSIDLTQVKEMEKWTPEQDRSFRYKITKAGIEKVRKILEMPEFRTKEKDIELVLQAAGHLSGTNIRKFVYSEPNYMRAWTEGFGSIVDPNYKFATKFKWMSRKISSEEYDLSLSEEEVSWLYLNFMKTIQTQRKNVETNVKSI